MSAPLDLVVEKLEAGDFRPRPGSNGFTARCPAHEDKRASLSVSEGEDGKVLAKCFAGCSYADIFAALGLAEADGFPPRDDKMKKRQPGPHGPAPWDRQIRATFPYRDADGNLLFEQVRFDDATDDAGKCAPRYRDGSGRWSWKRLKEHLNGQSIPLYRLPELRQAVAAGRRVYLPEGEKDVETLRSLGLDATTNYGGADGWKASYAAELTGAEVVVLPDNDPPGEKHAEAVIRTLNGKARAVRVLRLPGLPEKGDVSDWVAAGGTRDELERLVEEVPTNESMARADGAELLDSVAKFIRRFVVVTPDQVDVVALWVAHTWAFEASDQTPYLAILSAEKRSGKTRLLETLGVIVRTAWHAIQPSEAVLYRKISKDRPTLLLDETDALFNQRGDSRMEAVRALLNSGSRRGVTVPRCLDPKSDKLIDFEIFCPKALAGIGTLPETVGDRSFLIQMKRKRRSDSAERFRLRDVEKEARNLRARLEAWASSRVTALRSARPDLPAGLGDRGADGAEPLLAIADLAGGAWPGRARRAILALAGERAEEDESDGVQLLSDIRRILGVFARTDGVIRTERLIEELVALPESRWGRLGVRREPIDGRDLSKLLKPYGIRPRRIREGADSVRGYAVESFTDAFDRYLNDATPDDDASTTPATPATAPQSDSQAGQSVAGNPPHYPPQDEAPACVDKRELVVTVACGGSCGGSSATPVSDNRAGCGAVAGVAGQGPRDASRKRVSL